MQYFSWRRLNIRFAHSFDVRYIVEKVFKAESILEDTADKDKEEDKDRGPVRKRQMSKRHMSGVWGSSNPGESCANPYVLDSEMICYYLTTI